MIILDMELAKVDNSAIYSKGPYTRFMDIHSGGFPKTQWDKIIIQAPKEEAIHIFYNRFNQHPHDVACTCCGENFSVSESSDLYQSTGYDRNCNWQNGYVEEQHPKNSWGKYLTLDEYLATQNVLVIFAHEINNEERTGYLPQPDNGYDEGWND